MFLQQIQVNLNFNLTAYCMKKIFLLLIISLMGIYGAWSTPKQDLKRCKASLHDNILTISNECIEATFNWNNGDIAYKAIKNLATGKIAEFKASKGSTFSLPGLKGKQKNGIIQREKITNNLFFNDHLQVTITTEMDNAFLKRILRVYPNSPAIFTSYFIKAKSKVVSEEKSKASRTDMIDLGKRNLLLKSVRFYGQTDWRNNLVDEREVFSYSNIDLKGNILTIKDRQDNHGLFVYKKSPLEEAYHNYPGADFNIRGSKVNILGVGVTASLLSSERWTKGYDVAIGMANSDKELDILTALRQTQMAERNYTPEVNDMVLMNTWGDRSKDGRMSEKFIMNELDKCKELGVTHFQLDDGWQAGLSHNSAFKGKNKAWAKWKVADWMPHQERFPNGLEPLVRKANRLNIQLGLWFNPSSHNDYESWENDANILIGLYKKYGIKIFKIDGMQINSKKGEENFMAFYDKVIEGTNGQVIFNLDVTAGRRFGCNVLQANNNIFLENRYTDSPNYFPFRTLRNLWQLSRYIPTQALQIEFLNKWRNAAKYGNDPLAPINVPFDYTFVVTAIAQPLAWFEASGLPQKAFKAAPVIKTYNKVRNHLHSGTILPIGSTPDGISWTGFQSIINEKEGYFLVLREYNNQPTGHLKTWLPEGTSVKLKKIFGEGDEKTERTIERDGSIEMSLPKAHSYVLYQYIIQ
ncbi:alpha-galactosidase [Prolixibacteraceae bacterium JC049]|nr:alpha-galactosidase [Prolixibacteraceae bacterium JC049]